MGHRLASAVVSSALVVSTAVTAGATAEASAARDCATSSLHLHHRGAGGEASQRVYTFTVTNVTKAPCHVSGYLRVDVLATHDRRLLQARASRQVYVGGLASTGALPVVTLAAGGSASALLAGTTFAADDHVCPPAWGVAVRLPDRTTTVRMRFDPGVCSNVEITPLVPGLTGGHQ